MRNTKVKAARGQALARLEREKAVKYNVPEGVTPFTSTITTSKYSWLQSGSSGVPRGQFVPNLHVHSTSEPTLREGENYHITAVQELTYNGDGDNVVIDSDQQGFFVDQFFEVLGSKTSLDPSLIHSVYPPPGHADYWNTLPHVLFNDPHTPWLFISGNTKNPSTQEPWLALFVFTEQELFIPSQSLIALDNTVGRLDPSSPLTQSADLSIAMTNAEFHSMVPEGGSAMGDPGSTVWNQSMMRAIFIPEDIFNAGLVRQSAYDRDGSQTKTYGQWLMSHVRTVDTSGMTNVDGLDIGTYAVTVSQRTGPPDLTASATVYAHLVVVPGDDGTGRTKTTSFGSVGLCSLYSWSYTCLPRTEFTLKELEQNLGNSIQPLRLSNATLSALPDNSKAPWLRDRFMRGFSFAKYRPLTGEETMCEFRGPLMPNSPYDSGYTPKNLPSSDFGSDLAIIDQASGLIDVTYQLAWSLGRSIAMSDRSFSAALMRVRGAIHNQSLINTKKLLDETSAVQVNKPITLVLRNLSTSKTTLKTSAQGSPNSNFGNRWKKPLTQTGSRNLYSFVHPTVKVVYNLAHSGVALNVASAATANSRPGPDVIYDETNPPGSTDWATIFGWVMDQWFLGGIPILHMIPDPNFVPKESIRTFYIDPDWFTAFVDGAMSVAEHYTDQDEIRDAMKDVIQQYLQSNLSGKDYLPQLPRFGFFLRSELIRKYTNLKVSAPLDDSSTDRQEILRIQTIDQDLMIVLFDRIPGANQFPHGITISPPAHQLSFAIDSTGTPTASSLIQTWSKVYVQSADGSFTTDLPVPLMSGYSPSQAVNVPNYGFDFEHHMLRPYDLVRDAFMALSALDAPPTNDWSGGMSSLLGCQLIADYPTLTLIDSEPNDPQTRTPLGMPLSRIGWEATADSEQLPDNPASKVLDGQPTSFWHTEYLNKDNPGYPHTLTIDMKRRYLIAGLMYLPRQDGSHNGMIKSYSISVSIDGLNFNTVTASSSWIADTTTKTVSFPPTVARWVQLLAESEVNGMAWASAAEVYIIGGSTTIPINSIQTAKRAQYQLNPPLKGQDPEVPPKVAPVFPPSIRLTTPSTVSVPNLLRTIAITEITNVTQHNLYLVPSDGHSNTNGSTSGGLQPALQTFVYNLRSYLNLPPTYNLVSTYKLIKPDIPNYTTDVYFDIRVQSNMMDTASKRILEQVYVSIPILPARSDGPFAPFPVEAPNTNPGAPPPLTDNYVDAPPKNRITGVKIPKVDFIGLGQRYTVTTKLYSDEFVVTLIPNYSISDTNTVAQQLNNNADLSFVIRDVLLKDMPVAGSTYSGDSYSVYVYEVYNQSESPGQGAISNVAVPIYKMDPNT